MKKKVSHSLVLRIGMALVLLSSLFISPQLLHAQSPESLETPGTFLPGELAQMLAPIALYPDALLTQILMASTYPIEIVEADRWVQRHPDLQEVVLDDALLSQDWDPSVKALCHFPSILAQMSERIAETTNLGNAFLAQEAEVMDMVQELRAKAYAQGNLNSSSEQKVSVEKETIIIEPVDSRVIYLPYYDPLYVYGPWLFPTYPPYFWSPTRVRVGVGITFGSGITFGFSFGSWSYFDWPRRHIFFHHQQRPRFVRYDRWISTSGFWTHTSRHRRGVAYRDKSTAKKYGQYRAPYRDLTRGSRGFPVERSWEDRDRRGARTYGSDRDRQRRERNEGQKIEQKRMDSNWQRNKDESMSQPQKRLNRERQGKSRENIFNRVDEGEGERRSSERGRMSRKVHSDRSGSQSNSGHLERREGNARSGSQRIKGNRDSSPEKEDKVDVSH